MTNYQYSLKIYRDLKNVLDTAFDEGKPEGKLEGILEGKLEVARTLKLSGVPINLIIAATGLSEEILNDALEKGD
jgi:predicted transposase/invertase (TIGR01784 family)